MTEIAIKIANQVIQLPDPRPRLVAGSVGVYAVKLTYDAQWDNAPVRVVVFDGGLCNKRISVQDTTGTVTIPPECIAHGEHGNWLQIGVLGFDGTGALRITTRAMRDGLRIDPAGVSDADVPQDPPTATPGLWEQLVTDIGNLSDLQTVDKSSLVAAINELAAKPADLSLGITGATPGQIAKITAVDTNGKPTAWSPVDMPTGGGGSAVLYTEQNLTAAQQKQARTNIDVAGYNVINYLWPTEHSGREDTDIRTLLDSNVYIGIVRNSTAFPSPGLVMLQGPMTGNVYTAVLLAKDGLTYTATFQYVLSTKYINVLDPVAAASSKLISVKMTRSESGENVYTADRYIDDIDDALQAGHMALAYMPDAAGLQNSVGLITSCVRTERGSPRFVTVLGCFDTVLSSTQWQVDLDGITWTETAYVEYAPIDWVMALENAMPKPVYKTDAMTQAVGMDETGKLWTQPIGGSADTWELIASGEMSEAATLTVNKDANGNAFSLKSCTILVSGALSGGRGSYVRFAVTASGATYFVETSLARENMNTDARFTFRQGDVPTLTMCDKPSTAWQSGTCTVQMALRESDNALAAAQGAVSSLRIGPWSGAAKLGAGCKYALWGVRA